MPFPPLAAPCLHGLFEAQARRTPDAVALLFGGGCLSYAHLNREANRLARFLRKRGVRSETIVGVCIDSSPAMIVALLATLKAGGAYLPLDPAYPSERLGFMLGDAGVGLVLTSLRCRATLPPSYVGETVCVDADGPQWQSESGDDHDGGADANSLAYVIYTSGSTGRPKGVLLEHAGAVNNLAWRQERFPLTADDRMLQTYSLSFDPSVWAIFWPLAAGATLVLPRPGGIADPAYLAQTLADERITVAGFGPAMLGALLARPDIARCRPLRHVFCGGEAMPPGLPRRFYDLLPASLHNAYGPTEATIDAAWYTVPRGFAGASVPIGHAVSNTRLSVRDDRLQPVPDGAEGELCIAGAGLARGYLCRPELTAERFLPDPSGPAGTRLYRTGDRVRRGGGGELYFAGRRDGQIQLRGIRIETGEIEAALGRHPHVRDAVVTPHGERLAAYVVAAPGAAPTGADLRRFLSASLPAALVPSAFVFLDALPLTPGGKRDRAALPPPDSDWERGDDFVPPQDDLQRQLAEIWESLLDLRPIGIHDRFQELGGHSLLAARMLDQVGHACGRSVPLSVLYESDTIEHLADHLRRGATAAEDLRPTRITGGERRPFFFLYGYHPLGGFYCRPLARRLPPEQPFYAVHPPRLGRGRVTIQGMAASAIRAVRAVQPDGPYRLGGFCGSGLVAYEMARQLAASGQEVEFLALVEVHAIAARLRLFLRRLAPGPRAFLSGQSVWLPALAWAQRAVSRWRNRGRAPGPGRMEDCDRAAGAYVPRPYAGKVTLIRAADDPATYPADPVRLWREIAPRLAVRDIPGTHLSCLGEHVGGLGDCLGDCLNDLDR